MVLFVLAYLGGVLTIASPCILPVLPFVFARADQPFFKSGLPMLLGMALTFAGVATLAAVGGGWAVEANSLGRAAALLLLALFGLALVFPELSERAMRPLVRLGDRLSQSADSERIEGKASFGASLALGVATGLLWAPCAGPILGLILTGAALQGANLTTTAALLAYALGAATSLALALVVGGRVFSLMKRSLGAGEWIRRGIGAAVLVGVAAIGLGLDTGLLARLSSSSTTAYERQLLDLAQAPSGAGSASTADRADGDAMKASVVMNGPAMTGGGMMMKAKPSAAREADLPIEGLAPSLAGATEWLNSQPLTTDALKGKVVLVDFWTYSCINCLRAIPYVRAWAEKYKDQGLVVIGVHAPEFAFEKSIDNVKRAVQDLKIDYPVAIDNDYALWRAFDNQYWPAHYFIDAEGRIRHRHFGEGDYEGSEKVIQQLLGEAGKGGETGTFVSVRGAGAEAAADLADAKSPETYIGYERAENFASPGGAVENAAHDYELGAPRLNEWSLAGNWTIQSERAVLNKDGGAIDFRFHARDLHLVLAPGADGKPVRFRVSIDGASPGDNHGVDVDASGEGTVTEDRLYQLVRETGKVEDHTFEVRFLDPGVNAYAFTFG